VRKQSKDVSNWELLGRNRLGDEERHVQRLPRLSGGTAVETYCMYRKILSVCFDGSQQGFWAKPAGGLIETSGRFDQSQRVVCGASAGGFSVLGRPLLNGQESRSPDC